MVLSKELLSKYPGTTMHEEVTRANDSMYQCLKHRESLLSVDVFAALVKPGNSEIFNGYCKTELRARFSTPTWV